MVLIRPTIPPSNLERPSQLATNAGLAYAATASDEHKKDFGQFFTPLEIGQHLASLVTYTADELRLLDPGFGTGVLACSLIEQLVERNPGIRRIQLDAYDIDQDIVPHAKATLAYLREWLNTKGIDFVGQLISEDFILKNRAVWEFPLAAHSLYDIVISNPPYFKLGKDDPRNSLARKQQQEQPNIYSLFIVLATLLTKPGGELVFIIPRSFCSGPYFEKFRAFTYRHLRFDLFHLFHSRSKAFKKDAVLQENIIFKATRAELNASPDYSVRLVASESGQDLHNSTSLHCHLTELVDLGSREKVLFLPTDEQERKLIADFKNWRHRLADFGVKVSTGPVVAFRTVPHLRESPDQQNVPLLWIDNVRRWKIDWPNTKGRHQYVAVAGGSKAGLVPTRNYVLLRRFSAKDDKHRLIAAPFYASEWPYSHVGLENKLNYLHSPAGQLTDIQTAGLTALLNSDLYDAFFRIFNGNTQVSATEAQALPMPSLAVIEEMGNAIQKAGWEQSESIVKTALSKIQ